MLIPCEGEAGEVNAWFLTPEEKRASARVCPEADMQVFRFTLPFEGVGLNAAREDNPVSGARYSARYA
jgi:hypothetical protein